MFHCRWLRYKSTSLMFSKCFVLNVVDVISNTWIKLLIQKLLLSIYYVNIVVRKFSFNWALSIASTLTIYWLNNLYFSEPLYFLNTREKNLIKTMGKTRSNADRAGWGKWEEGLSLFHFSHSRTPNHSNIAANSLCLMDKLTVLNLLSIPYSFLYSRSSDTILGETSDSNELFLVDECDDNPLGSIVQKCAVSSS